MTETYLFIAELVYQWEYAIIFVAGILISVLLWYIEPKVLSKNSRKALISMVLFTSMALSSYIAYVTKKYEYLPEVNYNSYSYIDVEQMLINKGFKIDEVHFDAAAQEKLKQGAEPTSYYFKVIQMQPEQGTFVDKDTAVTLSVTWINCYENSLINSGGSFASSSTPNVIPENINQENFDAKVFYGDVDTRYIEAYNSNEFSLLIIEERLKMYTDKGEHGWGLYPKSNISVEVQLINYETNKVINTKTAYIGDEIKFNDIPAGTYYYMVVAEGYKTYVPYSLFRLEYTTFREKDELPWLIAIEKEENSYSEAVKIQICSEQGIPHCNTEAEIRVVSEDDLSPKRYISYPMTSDENGYLTVWSLINGVVSYDDTKFSICDGCGLEVRLTDNDKFIQVEIVDGVGRCILPN